MNLVQSSSKFQWRGKGIRRLLAGPTPRFPRFPISKSGVKEAVVAEAFLGFAKVPLDARTRYPDNAETFKVFRDPFSTCHIVMNSFSEQLS